MERVLLEAAWVARAHRQQLRQVSLTYKGHEVGLVSGDTRQHGDGVFGLIQGQRDEACFTHRLATTRIPTTKLSSLEPPIPKMDRRPGR
ncbi:hypothetical protein QIS99_31975, partial [Streptomyces sp. B-S-A8]